MHGVILRKLQPHVKNALVVGGVVRSLNRAVPVQKRQFIRFQRDSLGHTLLVVFALRLKATCVAHSSVRSMCGSYG